MIWIKVCHKCSGEFPISSYFCAWCYVWQPEAHTIVVTPTPMQAKTLLMRIGDLLLDASNGFTRVEALGASVATVHDSVASVKLETVI